MRIKDGFELKNMHGEYIVISKEKKDTMPSNSIILTDTAVFLWDLLKNKDVTKAEMLNALIENFDISTVLAI